MAKNLFKHIAIAIVNVIISVAMNINIIINFILQNFIVCDNNCC